MRIWRKGRGEERKRRGGGRKGELKGRRGREREGRGKRGEGEERKGGRTFKIMQNSSLQLSTIIWYILVIPILGERGKERIRE